MYENVDSSHTLFFSNVKIDKICYACQHVSCEGCNGTTPLSVISVFLSHFMNFSFKINEQNRMRELRMLVFFEIQFT